MAEKIIVLGNSSDDLERFIVFWFDSKVHKSVRK